MSTTILAVIINLLATVLPLLGIEIGTEQLTTTVTTILAIGTGIYIWWARVQKGDVSKFGTRL